MGKLNQSDDLCLWLKDAFDNVIDVVFNVERQLYVVKIDGLKINKRKELREHKLAIISVVGVARNAIVEIGEENRVVL